MKVSIIGCSLTWTNRPTSSYCINNNILVDAGEGTLKYYEDAGVDFEKIKHIFITHMHTDHTLAVINHVYNAVWYHLRNKTKELFIYGPKGIKKYFKKLIKVAIPEYKNMNMSKFLHIFEIKDFNSEISVENLKVKFYQLKHGQLEDIAYVFDDGKTKVGFSGDCTHSKELDDFVDEAQILFLECCAMKTTKNHLGYDLYSQYVQKYPNKTFIAIHCENKIYENADKLHLTLAKAGDIKDL